jgi:hypothetical protein
VEEDGLATVSQDVHFFNQAPCCPTAIVIFLLYKPHRRSEPEQTLFLSGQHRYNPKPFSTAAISLPREETKHPQRFGNASIRNKTQTGN